MAEGIQLEVDYPFEINNGKWLLYLVSSRVSGGGGRVAGKCTQDHTNVRQFKLPSPAAKASARRNKRYANEEVITLILTVL